MRVVWRDRRGKSPAEFMERLTDTVCYAAQWLKPNYAYHGAHPFTVLYWAAQALDQLGDVILVGGPETTSRMGLKRADSVAEAFGMAQDTVGPSATYMHIPPLFMCKVS